MPAHEWTTAEQSEFLHGKMAAYVSARDDQKQTSLSRFWNALEEKWFKQWPEEMTLGLPARVPGAVPLTEDELKLRLKAWMRYRDGRGRNGLEVAAPAAGSRKTKRMLFRLLKKNKSTRPLRNVEMYQKIGGGGPVEVRVLTEEETAAKELKAEELFLARIQKNRSARLSLRRAVSSELYAAESDEVKSSVDAATREYNEKRAIGNVDAADDAERMPEEYQKYVIGLHHQPTSGSS
ncbi:hypothetical protein B0H10DRAFT_1950857 [Mycena sp. CBHHK59/15]|nr:hypothetical protein B0H10DRAFT_1950857 [Mycena sp. CBHHK59/15]